MKFASIFIVVSAVVSQAMSGVIPFVEDSPSAHALEARQNNRFRNGGGNNRFGNNRGGNGNNRVVTKKPVHRMKPKLRFPPHRFSPPRVQPKPKPQTQRKTSSSTRAASTARAAATSQAATSAAASAAAATTSAPPANNNNNNNNGGNNNGGNNNGGNNNGGGNNGGNNNGGGGNDNPQTSLTLSPQVIGPNLALDGQATPTPGQVSSLTSTNNYINFCLGKTITNGLQVVGGSCNPVPMGDMPAKQNIPSCKFQFPTNNGRIAANTEFTVRLATIKLDLGNFVNAQTNYYSAPQQLNGQGIIIAHSHVVIQKLASLDSTEIPDPNVFTFFKGLNDEDQNGVVSAVVTGGLAAGVYKISSINTAANHQPALAPVAQHGSMDDVVYFTVE